MDTTTLPFSMQQPVFNEASLDMDDSIGAAIFRMLPQPRPCFTPNLLDEIKSFQRYIGQIVNQDMATNGYSDWKYVVLASGDSNTFNLGGDLSRFANLIECQDRAALMEYAIACIDGAHSFHTHMDLPLTSIALVEGNAQGGGFEAALSCNVLIAERGTMLGFPEVLFNMFPGMGAYSFLSRRIGHGLAERLIYSGDLYTAESLYDMGVIDVLADQGEGRSALVSYIRTARRRTNALKLIQHVRDAYDRVPYEELLSITSQWVDAALNLGSTELGVMKRLVRAQNKRSEKLAKTANQQRVLKRAT
ncbi:MAG: crotonase/enoyl-CoA hydratase family protein [Candidatus Thiodiazotropha sp.]